MAPKKGSTEVIPSAPVASGRRLLLPRKIMYEDADKLGIRCFNQMRNTGLKCLMDMDERIYPSLVREFFSSLKFKENSLEAEFSLRGISGSLSEENLGRIIGFESDSASVKVFNNVSFEGYDKKKAIFLLTGLNIPSVPYHSLDLESKIMFHAITHLITPKVFKQNSPNNREIFYLWCVKNGYTLNAPFIILSHMKAVVSGDIKDIPYGMVVTMIGKHFGVTISDDEEVVEIGTKTSYDRKHLMSFMAKSGMPAEKEISDDDKSSEEIQAEEKPEKKRKLLKEVGESVVKKKKVEDKEKEEKKKKKNKGKEVQKHLRSSRKSLRISKKEKNKEKEEEGEKDEEIIIELEEEVGKEEVRGEVEVEKEEEVRKEKEVEEEIEKEKGAEKIGEEEPEEVDEKEIPEESEKDFPKEDETESPKEKEAEKESLSFRSPLDKPEEVPTSKGKEKVSLEETDIKQEFVDVEDIEESFSMVKGFNLLSDQLSEMNRHLAKQSVLLEEIATRLTVNGKTAEECFDALSDMESALKMKKTLDADHQDRMFDLLTRIFSRITEAASIREEKKSQLLQSLKDETTKFNLKRSEVRVATDTPPFSTNLPPPVPKAQPSVSSFKEPSPPPVKPPSSIIPFKPSSSAQPKP